MNKEVEPLVKPQSLAPIRGHALNAVILLRDWEKYGLAERICYHFDLTGALAGSEQERSDPNKTNHQEGLTRESVCGVLRVLECIPTTTQGQKLSRRDGRALKRSLLRFNAMARTVMEQRQFFCHEPPLLPLRIFPASRVMFAYELTRIAFCLDAKATLTNSYGFGSSTGPACCPIDRLAEVTRLFLTSLAQPIQAPGVAIEEETWKPEIAVSVIAVFPSEGNSLDIDLLVRDFRVTDVASAALLSKKIRDWALGEVESKIADRLAYRDGSLLNGRSSYDAWSMPFQSSSLQDILDAADVCLENLSSAARPAVVIATDCSAVGCDGTFELLWDKDRSDLPISVLDLSGSRHARTQSSGDQDLSAFTLLTADPLGGTYQLHLPDDREALQSICRASGGAFWDADLLEEGARTLLGNVGLDSPFSSDHLFSSPQHTLQTNAVQWYTLFNLSHLSPRPQPTLGVPPVPHSIIQDKAKVSDGQGHVKSLSLHGGRPFGGESSRQGHIRTMLSSYIINPVPIKGVIMMRVREGFRVKQYGQSTLDPAKVSIQFTLGLEVGVIVHYELSYKSINGVNNMIGFAHVKIELFGDPSLIQMVKRDLVHGNLGSPNSSEQQISDRICKLLRWMRKEDTLQSSLTPIKWGDQLKSPDSPFVRRLGILSTLQQRRHFRLDEFDCVCVGNMPYDVGEHDFLSEFRDQDDGSEQLVEALDGWSSQYIKKNECFVKQTISGTQSIPAYCFVKVARSPNAGRIWTVAVNTIGGSGASDRLSFVFSLKKLLGKLSHVRVLRSQMGKFLVSTKKLHFGNERRNRSELMVEKYCDHSTWELVTDPELLPLLIKRRTEIGNFLLLESCDQHALLAKIVHKSDARNEPGTLVQYQLSVLTDKVVVDFHIESESGQFSRASLIAPSPLSEFHRLVQTLGKRDQECALALQSRRALLQLLHESKVSRYSPQSQIAYVQRLLGYASNSVLRLRFYQGMETTANEHLRRLTEQMLLSQLFGPRVVKLGIDASYALDGKGPGDWFLIEYDKNTLSIMHFPQEYITKCANDVTTSQVDMAFFTIGVGDLYSQRDDVIEDGSDDDHITEHMCVTDFTDSLDRGHKRNYACSAYLAALDSTLRDEAFYFASNDLAHALSELAFLEVIRVEIMEEREGALSKLYEVLSSALEPVPGDELCFIYHPSSLTSILARYDEDEDPTSVESFDDEDGGVVKNIEEEDGSVLQTNHHGGLLDDSSSNISVSTTSTGGNEFHSVRPVPVFVKILVDDELASVQDLQRLKRSASIAVLLSLYNEDPYKASKRQAREFPPSHVSATADLSSLLNSHVAEQHLGRLRSKGFDIREDELRFARICLRQARFSVASTFDIYFYISKSDSMVSPSTAARDDTAFEEGYKILSNQLNINKQASLKVFDDGYSFLVLEQSESSNLSYFCFLSIRRSRGLIAVEAHHPAGADESAKIMRKMHRLISESCHRTNQILLLERLHALKNASSLLIPPDSGNGSEKDHGVKEKTTFDVGAFQCPTLFRTTFELFHRCATNPLQVARTLEATVLHIFAVSNRMRVFVYKDEQGSIFYMMLSTRGGGIEPDGEIELLVHGIDEPGPSVTKQLRELLQKRLHSIAVEMLSSVLTKNPRYLWKHADINFVLSFENIWNQLDDGDSSLVLLSPHVKKYAFPKIAADPGMVLLYFRQNICGSTFFQQLLAPDSIFVQGLDGDDDSSCLGEDLPNMMFYYNNNSSKLDPEFQGLSTLTKKGAEFSRMTGTGVALIEVCLIDKEGRKLSSLPSARETFHLDNKRNVDLAHLRMIDFMDFSEDTHEQESQIFVQVKVYDTALKRDVLHEWLKMTLNQGLTAWTIENLLRRKQTGDLNEQSNYGAVNFSREEAIDRLCPLLPAITNVLESSYDLPHPAVLKYEYEGSDLRASNVAKFAFELTTGVILEQMRLEAKELQQGQELPLELCTIRLSRNELPEIVDLSRFRPKQDEPVDCPEYIVFYRSRPEENGQLKLFEHVVINDKSAKSDLVVAALERVKENNPMLFMRSLAFVLVVKRNRRLLLAYNWSASLYEKIATRIVAKENQMSNIARSSIDNLQRYSLRMLAPRTERITKEQSTKLPGKSSKINNREEKPNKVSSNELSVTDVLNSESQSAPRRRINRPTSIRKPKLIGKSVEGSALHAVAASRARASSNLFKGNPSGNTSAQKQPIQTRKGQVSRLKSATPKAAVERRQVTRSNTYVDPQEASLQKHYSSLTSGGQTRMHTEQVKTTKAANSAVWPLAMKRDVSFAGAWSLLQENGFGWALVSEMLPFPSALRPSFISSFAELTTSWTQDFMVLPLQYKNDLSEWSVISSKIRAVMSAKCVCITRLSVTSSTNPMVTAESFILLLPRRNKDRRVQMRKRRCLSNSMREKDATGLDLLVLRSKQMLRLDKALFDHAASIAEGAMRSVDGFVKFGDILKLVQDLILHRALTDQRLVLRSNYRAFSTKIVLSSFCDSSLSKYDSPTLFKWLCSSPNNRNLHQCGEHGLCFKREILVNGTCSVCFMTQDTSSTDSLCLVILCRTQGRNLQEFMFRPGSHVAISIIDNIAVECAGLAYQELRMAAKLLNRDNLWTKISGKSRFGTPSVHEIEELMSFCAVKSISEFLKSSLDLERVEMVCNGNVLGEWAHYCSRLEREPAFSPSWALGSARRLFYCRDEDLFLILTAHYDKTLTIDVMEREEKYDTNSRTRLVFAVQKLLNYLLLSSWNDMGL